MVIQILLWWLVVQVLGLLALPVTTTLFQALPDRGYAFSKTLGLLLTGYGAWLLAMLGLGGFSAPLLIGCACVLGALGLALHRQQLFGSPGGLARLRAAVRPRLGLVVCYEALFLLALIFVALMRARQPDPWGTERPMDFAFFNAIQRGGSFPPHDPWLAGYSINYYYFGYLLMAAVGLLSGLEPGVSYNLSLALVFALTALGVAGLVVNLIGLTGARAAAAPLTPSAGQAPIAADEASDTSVADAAAPAPHEGSWVPVAEQEQLPAPAAVQISPVRYWLRLVGRAAAALLSAVLVLLAANQGGSLQLLSGLPMVLALQGPDMARAVSNGLGPRGELTLEQPVQPWGDQQPTSTMMPMDTWRDFNWWNPSRALWDRARDVNDPTSYYAITEFPFFSFWLGDMHPHVMALPFGVLALALALQFVARPTPTSFAQGQRGWLELVLVGLVLGSLYTINSWDFPTYLLLFVGALLLLFRRHAPAGRWLDWQPFLIQAALAVAAAVVLFVPFYLTFHSLVGGKEPLVNAPLLSTLTRTVGFVTWTKTPLESFLIIFGLFLLPLVAYVLAEGRQAGQALVLQPADADESTEEAPARLTGLQRLLQVLPWLIVVGLAGGLAVGFPLLALLPLAIYAGLLALLRAAQPASAFVLWAFALVCLVCFGTEVIYIRDVFEARMNTIFKFYYQSWLIWGALAGYALWWLWARCFSLRRPTGYLLSAATALLLVGALVYPWLTVGRSLRDSEPIGLQGKTPRQNTPAGVASIEWLRSNAPSDAVVLEAVGDSYDSTGLGMGGISASTGLQTVIGWPGHESQWRAGDPAALEVLELRRADVATIYSTANLEEARALLERYQVDYIYVGYAEQTTYPAEGLAKLPQLGETVFQQEEVTIYQLRKPSQITAER